MPPAAPVVAIDGPSGSGKGTISRAVAGRVGWHWLDSGALYRLVALAGATVGLDPADVHELFRVCAQRFPGGGFVFDTVPQAWAAASAKGNVKNDSEAGRGSNGASGASKYITLTMRR